ncbi:MAG: transposase [Oscillospiraceae bacterium]|nr:transposase [Clostridia bacterium]MBR0343084.1 transposase [Oscillospiraceae bacterium]
MEMIGAVSLLRNMPEGYEDACYETKAIVRKRDIKDPNDLMMLVLFHLLTGCSLIEVSEISKLAKLGDISDVAFMKRFSNCGEWFKWILTKIQEKTRGTIKYEVPEKLKQYRILAVDASDVKEKGKSSRIFRLHFALDIVHMHAALYNITDNSVGEHLRNYDLSPNDLVLADRVYSCVSGIEYCLERNCQYIARMRMNSFKPYDEQGKPLNILEMISGKESGEMNVFARKERGDDRGKMIPVRICFKRKTEEALEITKKKLKRKETKKQTTISESAYAFNEYIVLASSLDDSISFEEILELYRFRWQVELYFKRLKSILDYGEMPKKSEKSIFAWLNGKLMISLLIETLIGKVDFSPSGDCFEEYMERDEVC